MNYRKIFSNLGTILMLEAVLMVLPVTVAVAYRESDTIFAFALTIAALTAAGLLFKIRKPVKQSIYARDGYMEVALAWLLMSAFGALPFVINGCIPNYIDAFFETVSGFTTTGSSILSDIEALPRSMLFWRSFTHFIGGMGILVFVIAIFPKAEGSDMHIMRAEVPGPTVGKLVSRIRASARILYGIYTAMTVLLIILLVCGGMPFFDSVVNAFATAGTGGFCVLNNSIAGYNSAYCEVVITVFMILFGMNFNLYYMFLIKQGKRALLDEELRWYLGIIVAAASVITLMLTFTRHPFGESARYAFFQVASIISTTGFSSTDFNMWPTMAKAILLLLMFIGGCAGSTGGSIKVSRIVVLFKNSVRTIKKAFNPRRVETVKLNGRSVDEDTVNGITGFFATFMFIIAISVFLVSIDGKDIVTTITSVITCIANVGPGLGEVIGPVGNFGKLSPFSKIVLSFDMLAGRLELIPMFMLFSGYLIPERKKDRGTGTHRIKKH